MNPTLGVTPLQVHSAKEDLCGTTHCPLQPGIVSFASSRPLPSIAPSGELPHRPLAVLGTTWGADTCYGPTGTHTLLLESVNSQLYFMDAHDRPESTTACPTRFNPSWCCLPPMHPCFDHAPIPTPTERAGLAEEAVENNGEFRESRWAVDDGQGCRGR